MFFFIMAVINNMKRQGRNWCLNNSNVLIIFFLTLILNCFKPSCKMEFQFFKSIFCCMFLYKKCFLPSFSSTTEVWSQLSIQWVIKLVYAKEMFIFELLLTTYEASTVFMRQLGKYWKVARTQNQTTITKFT